MRWNAYMGGADGSRARALRVTVLVAIMGTTVAAGPAATAGRSSPEPTATPIASLSLSQPRVGHTATLLTDGSVLVVGGRDDREVLATAERYDPVSRHFTEVAPLPAPVAFQSATRLSDGRVLLLGGLDTRQATADAVIFDPATDRFSEAGRLARARMLHTATLLDDGTVLVVGGIDARGEPLDSAEIHDPATGRSTPVGSLAGPRMYHTADLLDDGRVLVSGGARSLTSEGRGLASAESYDPRLQRFTSASDLRVARMLPAATRLGDGRVLVSGGVETVAGAAGVPAGVRTVEAYDPTTGRWAVVGELLEGRAGHTATLLDDGGVLMVGGAGTATTEIFDPATGLSDATGPGSVARSGHRATRLDDGTVLITGGMVTSAGPALGRTIASAELFDPGTRRFVASGPIDDELSRPPVLSPTPSPRPLGRTVGGGRVELPGSGFAITLPDDWTAEVRTPDPPIEAAVPGSAWEALRAHDPDRRRGCAVYVGVATDGMPSLASGSGIRSGGSAEPRWSEDGEVPTLEVPDPAGLKESPSGGHSSSVTSIERLASADPRVHHDVMYAIVCAAEVEWDFAPIMDSLETTPPGPTSMAPATIAPATRSVRAAHILYSPDDDPAAATELAADDPAWDVARAEAERGAATLRAIDDLASREEAFATAARADSDDTASGANGGDLGAFSRDVMVPEFGDAIFDAIGLVPGDIIGPVRTPFGWHVIMYLGEADAATGP